MTPSIKIRPGRPEDLARLLALDRQLIALDSAFDPSLDTAWSDSTEARDFYRERLLGQTGVAFVAETTDGTLAGFLVGAEAEAESYRKPMRLAEVECLFLESSHRGQGLGERLILAFETWARQQGIERLTITVSARNTRARAFYERLNYADYDVVLEKPLTPESSMGSP